jgi:hypothetical protein
VNVAIDLAEMGTETRSFGNLINHLNAKMDAANLATRFAREQLPHRRGPSPPAARR